MGNVTADRAWDVHPVTEADIEAYLDIYLNSYPAYKTLDEERRATTGASILRSCGRTPRLGRWACLRAAH